MTLIGIYGGAVVMRQPGQLHMVNFCARFTLPRDEFDSIIHEYYYQTNI